MARKISTTLLKAADLIDSGWCKGQYMKETKNHTSYCLLGAVETADKGAQDAWNYLKDCFVGDLRIGPVVHGLVSFNDSKETEKTEVLDLLLNAAYCAKMEGK